MWKETLQPKTLEILDKYKNECPVPILQIAKDLGLKIYTATSLTSKQSGLIQKENDGYVIYVNERHAPTRKKFTIAHEIAHFLEHKDNIKEDYITLNRQTLKRAEGENLSEDREKMETKANRIAAELLMPKEKFKEVWVECDSIEDVANKFQVSVSATTLRGNNLFREMII